MRNFLLSTFYFLLSKKRGQSLVEVLVTLAVGTILIIGAAMVIAPALKINSQSYKVQTGTALARELLENIRVWAESDWHTILNLSTSSLYHYYINSSRSPFTAVSGNESIVLSSTTYTRYFYVDDVYRDAGGDNIVASSGAYDPSTKKITVQYSWQGSATSSFITYMTRNRNNIFGQTDWSGGAGQNGPVTSTNNMFSTSTQVNYSTTTGSIIIDL